jgi:DNA invertase Pin-like site-specific DNA recombinase
MVLTVLGMVAEMELGFIRDRQRASIEAARRRGFTRAALSRSTAPPLCPCASWKIAKTVGCKRANEDAQGRRMELTQFRCPLFDRGLCVLRRSYAIPT